MVLRAYSMPSEPILGIRVQVRRLRRSVDGATAVEFGLVALPFFALLWSVIETGMAFFAQQVLDNAVARAGRQLYTNQFSSSYSTMAATYTAQNKTPPTQQAYFKTLICSSITVLIDCSKLDIDVKTVTSFADAQTQFKIPITNGVYDTSGYGYLPPASKQICVVRASMEYPKYTSIASPTVSLKDGNRLLLSALTFRAEPF